MKHKLINRQLGAESTGPNPVPMRFDITGCLAGSNPTRTLGQNDPKAGPKAPSKRAPEQLHQRPDRSRTPRPAAHTRPAQTHRQRRGARPRLLLERAAAVRPQARQTRLQHVRIHLSGPQTWRRGSLSARWRTETCDWRRPTLR